MDVRINTNAKPAFIITYIFREYIKAKYPPPLISSLLFTIIAVLAHRCLCKLDGGLLAR